MNASVRRFLMPLIMAVPSATSAVAQTSPYSTVLIRPSQGEGGSLEITCHDDAGSGKRLVITALTVRMIAPGNQGGVEKTPYFLGWYVDRAATSKELCVGVELPADAKSGTATLALPSLFSSEPLSNEMLLSIATDNPNVSDYFASATGRVVYAPLRRVELDFAGSRLRLIDHTGWKKKAVERLIWEEGKQADTLLEAKFAWSGPWERPIIMIGGMFGGIMFGLFVTHYALMSWFKHRLVWVIFGAVCLVVCVVLWRIRLVATVELLLPFVGCALGITAGALIPPRGIEIFRRFADPKPSS